LEVPKANDFSAPKHGPTKPSKPKESSSPTANNTKPTPVLKGMRMRTSALSLKSVHQKVAAVASEEETEIDRETLPKTPCSEEKLLKLWKDYAKDLHKLGDKSLSSILSASSPTLNNFAIHLILPSKFMEEQLLRARPKILKFLRESANNYSLDLHIQVLESETKKFVYTPQEKYEKLKEINPNIELLRKRFKLDL
jgi:DNA polymerase-3 subunit gamma/tau